MLIMLVGELIEDLIELHGQQVKRGYPPRLNSALVRCHLQHCVQLQGPQYKNGPVGVSPEDCHKNV